LPLSHLLTPLTPRSTLFPYTTLFRSRDITISKFERANAVKLFAQMCPKKDADHFMQLLGRVFWVEIVHNKKGDKVYANLKQESIDRKSTRLNSSHVSISYAVFCLKKK